MNLKDSKRFLLLPDFTPEVTEPNMNQLRNINHDMKSFFSPGYFYSGSALLCPESRAIVAELKNSAGKCLGGGVLASRDLEWIGKGKNGEKPGRYIPQKKLFGYETTPQSYLPSEWALLEYGLWLRPPYGDYLLIKYDDVFAITMTLKQGKDKHIQFDGKFGDGITEIHAQANATAIGNILEIAAKVGVPTYA